MRNPGSLHSLREAAPPYAKRLTVVILSLGLAAMTPHGKPSDSQRCRQFGAAILTGNIDEAVAMMDPEPGDEAQSRETAARLTSSLAGALKQMTPYLERTLPDILIESHQASLQIWSFGDKEVYFVGCLIRGEGRGTRFALELRSSVDTIVQIFKAKILAK